MDLRIIRSLESLCNQYVRHLFFVVDKLYSHANNISDAAKI